VISDYLDSLAGALRFNRSLSGRVRQEVEDHLREAVAADPTRSGGEAERRAIARFGDPRILAAQLALVCASIGALAQCFRVTCRRITLRIETARNTF
jgi:hypothetical protein